MKKNIKIFIYNGDITEGIIDSQVLSYLDFLKGIDHNLIFINFISIKTFAQKYRLIKNKQKYMKEKKIFNFCFLALNQMKISGKVLSLYYSLSIGFVFLLLNLLGYNIILHSRGIWSTLFCTYVKKISYRCKLIFDMRADSVSEYKFLYPSMTSNAISHIERVQKKCVLESDICLMVSNALKKNIFHRYGDIDKTYIIPSIGRSDIFSYDSNIRECVRDKLGLSDKFVIGYSGSMHSWQRVDKAFELFEIVQSFRNDAVLLILTKDIEKAHELYGKNANSIIMSIEYEDLGRYVQCFDLGVLLRDKILLNKVSSPTKFSEYILCGVPVFVSTGIGDLEDIVTNMKLGVCVENFDDRSEFEREIKKFLITLFNRNLIAEFGKYYFCREAYINIYNDIYS